MPDNVGSLSKKRTNVRSLTIRERVLKASFKTLLALAPPLAERWAERLFSTPARREPSERLRETLSLGTPFSLDFEGRRLRGWTWGEGESVYFMHGWAGRAGQFGALVPPLVAVGYKVVGFDAPGHGESEGKRTSLVEFARSLTAVVERHGPARAVIAHSLGGAATALAMRRGLSVGRAVFVGTPSDPPGYFRNFLDTLGMPAARRATMEKRLEAEYEFRWDELSLPKLASALRAPLLVVHDRADAEVPWVEGQVIAGAWHGARLLSTSGLGHRRILRDDGVVASIVDFVSETDSKASSAAGRRERSLEC